MRPESRIVLKHNLYRRKGFTHQALRRLVQDRVDEANLDVELGLAELAVGLVPDPEKDGYTDQIGPHTKEI